MKRKILIVSLLIFSTLCSAQLFEVNKKEFLCKATLWGSLNLYNNRVDGNFYERLNEADIEATSSHDINFLDRNAIFKYSSDIKGWSDYTAYANLLTAAFITYDQPYFLDNMMVFSEVLLVQDTVGKWAKTFSGRYRPFMYRDDVDIEKKQQKNTQQSFYSLHSSVTFSAATFGYYYIYHTRGHSIPYAIAIYGTAAATATFRVLSGQHFPTDAMMGAFMGSTISYLVCKSYQNKNISLSLATDYIGIEYRF